MEIDTGSVVERITDWSSGGAHALEFRREYASSFYLLGAPVYSRLGPAWRSNFDAQGLYILSNGITSPENALNGDRLHFVMPNSIEYSFRKVSGVWKPVLPRTLNSTSSTIYWDQYRTDIDVTVTPLSDSVDVRMQNGDHYFFDLDGLLAKIVFADGYQQMLEYSGTYNTKVTDSLVNRLSWRRPLSLKLHDGVIYRTPKLAANNVQTTPFWRRIGARQRAGTAKMRRLSRCSARRLPS